MDVVSKLESRLGRFAFPGLVQAMAVLQLVTFAMLMLLPRASAMQFEAFLELQPERLLRGEVWRAFSHVLLPQSLSPLLVLISTLFMLWMGRGLDQAWGAFRVNLYVLGGILSLTVGALLFGYSGGAVWLFQTLLFAFAVFYPDEEILLFFVIPIKIKWLALIGAAITAFAILGNPALFPQIIFAHLNFLAAFGPAAVRHGAQRARVMERRGRFESAQQADEAFFHQCSVCGKTEVDDPKLEFRVTENGDEICSACRAKGSSGTVEPVR
jgi:hypothetical protein